MSAISMVAVLLRNLLNFKIMSISSSIDVLIITETWLNGSVFNNEILPDNYTIYRRDRDSRGGGVFLAIRDCIPSKLLPSPDNSEVITIQLCVPKPVVFLCSLSTTTLTISCCSTFI